MNFIRLIKTVEAVLNRNSTRSLWAKAFESIWYAYTLTSAMAEAALGLTGVLLVERWSFRIVGPSGLAVLLWSCLSGERSNPRSNRQCYSQILPWKYFTVPAICYISFRKEFEKCILWSLIWDFLCGQMTMSASKSQCDKERKQTKPEVKVAVEKRKKN